MVWPRDFARAWLDIFFHFPIMFEKVKREYYVTYSTINYAESPDYSRLRYTFYSHIMAHSQMAFDIFFQMDITQR